MLLRVKVGAIFSCEGLRIDTSRALCAAGNYAHCYLYEHRPSDVAGCWKRYATGGSIPGLLPRLSDQQLNVSQSINNTGNVRHSSHPFHFIDAQFYLPPYRCSRNSRLVTLIVAGVVESIRFKLALGGQTASCSGSQAPLANSSLHRYARIRSS